MARRLVAPSTQKLYTEALQRAFGSTEPPFKVESRHRDATEATKSTLRAAMRWRLGTLGFQDARIVAQLDELPVEWTVKRETEIPAEEELQAYQKACSALPAGQRAMALLPLAVGLRAREAITLPRRVVERAAEYGELLVLRKGGKEQKLPAGHAKELFAGMLEASAIRGARLGRPITWKLSGELLSETVGGAYQALYQLVKRVGGQVKLDDLHPHALRHGFATRMNRDGAPIATISWMLGHSNIATTQRYVHASAEDAKTFLRSLTK